MEIIIRNDMGITTFTTLASFDTFRGLVATRQKIAAIKFMREKEPCWGLKEAKDFVEACVFPPQVIGEAIPFAATLRDIKLDLREMITQDYAVSRDRLLDIYDKIVGLVK